MDKVHISVGMRRWGQAQGVAWTGQLEQVAPPYIHKHMHAFTRSHVHTVVTCTHTGIVSPYSARASSLVDTLCWGLVTGDPGPLKNKAEVRKTVGIIPDSLLLPSSGVGVGPRGQGEVRLPIGPASADSAATLGRFSLRRSSQSGLSSWFTLCSCCSSSHCGEVSGPRDSVGSGSCCSS